MVYDTIANASIPMAASNPKDFPKKKRANRTAKLKQCKLDARREQWLSQVKNKGCKGELDTSVVDVRNKSDRSMENLEIETRGERNMGSIQHYSDSDSPSNSPTSHTSSVLGSNESSPNFTGSGGSCSGSITGEDEEGDDGCLDDWEAVADALAATNDKLEQDDNPSSEPSMESESIAPLHSLSELTHQPASETETSNPKPEHMEKVQRDPPTCRAWKPDDAFRPQSLPNLSKQLSFPMKLGQHYSCGGSVWCCKNASSVPTSCPICCEDLDFTDSNFLPCLCGFRLCLFCHKRILEEDGRCPGCRKQYNNEPVAGEATVDGGSLTFRLARSCSMITRS